MQGWRSGQLLGGVWGVGFGGRVVQLVAHHAGSSTTTCSFIGVCRMHAFDLRARAAHILASNACRCAGVWGHVVTCAVSLSRVLGGVAYIIMCTH